MTVFTLLALVLFPALALLAVPLLAFAWGGKSRRGRRLLVVSAALLALEVPLLFLSHHERHFRDGWELNPGFTAAELVGTWSFEQQTISLRADGSFISSDGRRGSWQVTLSERAHRTGPSFATGEGWCW